MEIIKEEVFYTLMKQMKDKSKKIYPDLLICPKPGTRPGIGLVARGNRIGQTVTVGFSWGLHMGQLILTLSAGFALFNNLFPGSVTKFINDLRAFFGIGADAGLPLWSWILIVAFWVLLVIFTAFLRGKLSMFPGRLSLDLNGLSHISPTGQRITNWSEFVSVETHHLLKITRIFKADGDYVNLWVWGSEQKQLVKFIESLIEYYQPDDLQGKL